MSTLAVDMNAVESLQDWATTTTEEWQSEVQREWRRQKRLNNSLRFRARKKLELMQLRSVRESLETEFKRCLSALSGAMTKCSKTGGITKLERAMRQLAFEIDAIRTENLRMQLELQPLQRFVSLTSEAMESTSLSMAKTSSQSVLEASNTLCLAQNTDRNNSSWCVCFPNHEPSFAFHPFTRTEFDNAMKHTKIFDTKDIVAVGQVLGWTAHRATNLTENSLEMTRIRLASRIQCSFLAADTTLASADVDAWPLAVTPPDWSDSQRGDVTTQVLQEFDEDTHVMVCNIPGQTRLRYIQLAQLGHIVEVSGKRVVTFTILVASSETNGHYRAFEQNCAVKWISSGGYRVELTEVDENSVDAVFDRWAPCESKLHAQQLFIQWAEFAFRWSQRVTSSKLFEW